MELPKSTIISLDSKKKIVPTIRGCNRNALSTVLLTVKMMNYGKTSNKKCYVNTMSRTIDREEKEVRTIIVPNGRTLSATLLTEDDFCKVLFTQGSSQGPFYYELHFFLTISP